MIGRVLEALQTLRCPFSLDEYDLHKAACEALALAGISCVHEAVLGKRCRIDILCGDIGIELKRGKPTKSSLEKQLTRYAQTGRLKHLIVVSEQRVALPEEIAGVCIHAVCLFKLWGVADAVAGLPADDVMHHAQSALAAAQQALFDTPVQQTVPDTYEDDEVPAYMQDAPQSSRYYGTLSYHHRRKCWTVRGESCVTELC